MSGINILILFLSLLFMDGVHSRPDTYRKSQPGKPWVPPSRAIQNDNRYETKQPTEPERSFSLIYQDTNTPSPNATTEDSKNHLRGYKCPQAYGFFKYTNRCDEYVECKNYIPIAHKCSGGLQFDSNTRWPDNPCDIPSKVQCNGGSVIQTTTNRPQNTQPQNTLPMTSTTAPVVNTPRDFACPWSNGYFRNADSCGVYFECRNYIPRMYACPPGLNFNPQSRWTDYPCDDPSKVQCGRVPPVVTSSTTTTTTTTTTTPPPPPSSSPPPSNTPYPVVIKIEFSCPQPHGYYRNTDECGNYVECRNNIPRTYECPPGLQFNPQAKWTDYPCDRPTQAQCGSETNNLRTTFPPAPIEAAARDFSCPQPYGYFKHNDDCNVYIECKNYVPHTYTCPDGLYFNPDVDWTEYPCDQFSKMKCNREPNIHKRTTTTTSTTTTTTTQRPTQRPTQPPVEEQRPRYPQPNNYVCPQQHGYFRYTNQCTDYIECKNYIPRTYTCPDGLHFNPRVPWTDYPCDYPSNAQCGRDNFTPITTTTTTTTTSTTPPPTPAPPVIAARPQYINDPQPNYKCPQRHGYFKHTDQCGNYVECKDHVPRSYSCPDGFYFNPNVEWTEYPCVQASRVQCK